MICSDLYHIIWQLLKDILKMHSKSFSIKGMLLRDSHFLLGIGYHVKVSSELNKIFIYTFNMSFGICQIIWYILLQIIWPYWRLKDYSLLSWTEDFLFSVLKDSSLLSVFSSQSQLLLISFSERPLFCWWGLKGIQLQSIRSVAATPKRTCPTRTPTTSTVVSDSCPIEGSYKLFSYLFY